MAATTTSWRIARFTVLEALRTRLVWVAFAWLAASLLIASFLAGLAITEAAQIRTGVAASLLRIGAVFVVSVFAIASQVREFADESVTLALSRPVTRVSYYCGRLAGCALVSAIVALLSGVALAPYAPAGAGAIWAASLFCEVLIAASFALMCALALGQVPAALAATAAFYVLSRAIGAIALMSQAPAAVDAGSAVQRLIAFVVQGLAFLLPDLGRFTQSEWLMSGEPALHALPAIGAQTIVYLLLLGAVALADFQRKSF